MTEENPYAAPDADVQVVDRTSGRLAPRGRRLGGAILDTVLMMILLVPYFWMTDYMQRAAANELGYGDALTAAFTSFAMFLILQGYTLATRGQTIGKLLLNMRIVSVEDEKILPFAKVIGLRYLPQWVVSNIPIVGSLLALVNVLFIFGEQRRCVHDLIAGTKVVMTE